MINPHVVRATLFSMLTGYNHYDPQHVEIPTKSNIIHISTPEDFEYPIEHSG